MLTRQFNAWMEKELSHRAGTSLRNKNCSYPTLAPHHDIFLSVLDWTSQNANAIGSARGDLLGALRSCWPGRYWCDVSLTWVTERLKPSQNSRQTTETAAQRQSLPDSGSVHVAKQNYPAR